VKEAVTLLHGFTLNAHSWDELVPKLASRLGEGWKLITPDLRGHGSAPTTPCAMEDCAADLVALWDHLGIERSHVVGYSMGGRLALHVAVRLPERTRSLLTIGAHAGLDPTARVARRQADEQLAQRIEGEGVEAFVDYWSSLPMFAGIARRSPEFGAWLRGLRMSNTGAGLATSLRDMGAGAMEPLWDELTNITFPSTFAAGDADHAFVEPARLMAERVRGSRVRTVGDSGHAAQFEQPDATARLLADHLRWAATGDSSSTTD